MSKDRLSAKERETRKVTIILHAALTSVLNDLEEKDYPNVFVSSTSNNLANILFDHTKFMLQFDKMFKDENRKLTIFDKALCLAMSLERNDYVRVSGVDSRVPKRLQNVREKFITEAILFYLSHSSYNIRRANTKGDFNLDSFNNGHKLELKRIKSLLIEEFKKINFDYNKCLLILHEFYIKGVCYSEGLDTELIEKLKNNTTIKERFDSPQFNVVEENTYSTYKKTFRNMK